MIFVSAQTDNRYMLWQMYVQAYNFRRLGIEHDSVALIATNGTPSREALEFSKQFRGHTIFYPDTRKSKDYTASAFFHLMYKFTSQNRTPRSLFLLDNDVIFRRVPPVHRFIEDDTVHMSNTSNYLSTSLYTNECVDICTRVVNPKRDPRLITAVGGAQYLVKSVDPNLWQHVEDVSATLHRAMQHPDFEAHNTSSRKMDPWMAGMWTLLWTLNDCHTLNTPSELNFTWPTYLADTWNQCDILHNAGVMPGDASTMFHKGSFVNSSPFKTPLTHVSHKYASYFYAQEVSHVLEEFSVSF